jgi:Tol biopolymer transport system component
MTLEGRLREASSSLDRAVAFHGRAPIPAFGRRNAIRRASLAVATLAIAAIVGVPMIRDLGPSRVKTADQPKQEQKKDESSQSGGGGAPTKPGSAPGTGSAGKSGSSAGGGRSSGGAAGSTSQTSIADRIVFVSQRDGSNHIYVMNGDGSGQTRVTNNADEDVDPSWSPDGRSIVFTNRRASGESAIYKIGVDGTDLRRLTSSGVGVYAPAWSPDGRSIAYAVANRDATGKTEQPHIWVMDADGSNQRVIASGASTTLPAWSPDGQRLAHIRDCPETCDPGPLWTMRADGSDEQEVFGSVRWDILPAWSPDGGRIAFVNGKEVWAINWAGGERRKLTSSSDYDADPSWSHDGSRMVFDRDPDGHLGFGCAITTYELGCPYTTGPAPSSIWVINTDGTGLRQLTSPTTIDWGASFNTFAK